MSTQALRDARALSQTIIDLRAETEANRRIAQPIVDGLLKARLNRVAIVKQLDGLELSTTEALDVYESLSSAEPSVGWVTWNNSLPCLFSRFLEPHAREEIFQDPAWFYANSTRPTGKAVPEGDGYRVSGRWSLVSGCELAEWLALMCIDEAAPAGQPPMRFGFVRKGDFKILDTWHVGGLRGTGSHDVVVDDLLVPAHHTLSPVGQSTIDHPIGRVPIITTLSGGFAAQTLGVAQSALDTLVEIGRNKVSPDPSPDLRDRATNQTAIARAAVSLAAARRQLHESVGTMWERVCADGEASLQDKTSVWSASLLAIDAAVSTVGAMYACGGTTSIYQDCPLDRMQREVHVMTRHIIAQPLGWEDVGRVMFGMEPQNPMYAL